VRKVEAFAPPLTTSDIGPPAAARADSCAAICVGSKPAVRLVIEGGLVPKESRFGIAAFKRALCSGVICCWVVAV